MQSKPIREDPLSRRRFLWAAGGAGGAVAAASVARADAEAANGRLAAVINVRDTGATGDGETLDTEAVQKAIDQAEGGGIVWFPAGTYLCGQLNLRSGTHLHLTPEAELRASAEREHYEERAMLFGRGVHNVSMTGSGTIDAQGDLIWQRRQEDWSGTFRPKAIMIHESSRISIQDLKIGNVSTWTIHLVGCEDVYLRGLTVLNDLEVLNSDGINPDGCRRVHISDCRIRGGDDCIAVKSTGHGEGPYVCEDIVVTNCTLETKKTALKIGTETQRDIRRCTFSNIVIHGSARGIGIWVRDGGTIEGLRFDNIVMDLIEFPDESLSGEAIRVVMQQRRDDSPWGHIRDITVTGLHVRTPWRCYLLGSAERPIERFKLRDVQIVIDRPAEHKRHTLNALHVRHVEELDMRDVEVRWEGEPGEWGSALSGQNIGRFECSGFTSRQGDAEGAAIDLQEVQQIALRDCRALPGTDRFLRVREGCKRLFLAGNDLAEASAALDLDDEAEDAIVR